MRKPWKKGVEKKIENTRIAEKRRFEKAAYASMPGVTIKNRHVKSGRYSNASKYLKKMTNRKARHAEVCASGGYYKKTFGYDFWYAMS